MTSAAESAFAAQERVDGWKPKPFAAELAAEAGNVKKRAFRDLQKLSRSFLGLLLIAEDLAEVGDLEEARARAEAGLAAAEQATAEQLAALEQTKLLFATVDGQLRSALAGRREELRAAEKAVKDALDTAARTFSEADVEAARRIEAASAEALVILGNAREAATVLVQAAEEQAKNRTAEVDQLAAHRYEQVSVLDSKIAEGEARLANIKAAIAKYAQA